MVKAIILKKKDRGEADELVVFLSKELGWLRGIAKNSKKSRVRFGGHLEPFSLVSLVLRTRKMDDLVWIDEASVERGFLSLRQNLEKVAIAAYFLELSSLFLPENQPDEALFDYLLLTLDNLEQHTPNPVRNVLDEIRLLGILGYGPRFDTCPVCNKPIESGREARFSLVHGGAAHTECLTSEHNDLVLSADTLALVRRGLEVEPVVASRLKLSTRGLAEIRQALSAFVRFHRGNEVSSLVFLEQASTWSLKQVD